MTKDEPIALDIIDTNTLKDLKSKKARADWVKQVIQDNGLDQDKDFMDEIEPLLEELLKE